MILHPVIAEVAARQDALQEAVLKGRLTSDVGRYMSPGWAYLYKDMRVPHLGFAKAGNALDDMSSEDDGAIAYVITTDDEDRDGDIVRPAGAQLHNFSLNPVCFFGHQSLEIPIGVCRSPDGRITVSPEENRMVAVIYFDREDPDADFIYGKCKRKILNATSIAFVPIEAWRRDNVLKARTHNEAQVTQPGWYFNLYDLTELSCVGVPSNPKAVGLEKDLNGACRDIYDREKGFMSMKLQKAWQPYCAVAKGCWHGWCPVPGDEKDIGGGVVLKAMRKSSGPDEPTPVEPASDELRWDVYVDGKFWSSEIAQEKDWVLELARWKLKDVTPRPTIEIKGPYQLSETPPKERWNKSLTASVFDVEASEPDKVKSAVTFRVAGAFLGCQIKDLYSNSTMVPCPRMGSFLTGLKKTISPCKVLETRNFSESHSGAQKESPPVFETLQLNSRLRDSFLVQGTMFLEGLMPVKRGQPAQVRKGSGPHNHGGLKSNGLRFVLKFEPTWEGLQVTVLSKSTDAAANQGILDSAWTWAKENNFLRGEAFALSGEFIQRTSEGWDDVFLEEKNKKSVQRVLDLFNSKQLEFANRGVILTGPPGTGKTLSSRIVRNHAKGTFIWVSARDFHKSGSVGGIGLAFEMAKELAPSIICLEDVDNWLHPTTIDLLKTEMDGIARSKGVLTVLTTNFPEQLPDALIDRPGRFHDVLEFGLPTDTARGQMLRKWLPTASTKAVTDAVSKTVGYSGAHVYELAKFAETLIGSDGVPPDRALGEALTKVAEQRELITRLQLEGSNYNPLRGKRSMKTQKSHCSCADCKEGKACQCSKHQEQVAKAPAATVSKPFAGYADFDDCVSKNRDKKDPQAYCATIMRQVEGKSVKAKDVGQADIEGPGMPGRNPNPEGGAKQEKAGVGYHGPYVAQQIPGGTAWYVHEDGGKGGNVAGPFASKQEADAAAKRWEEVMSKSLTKSLQVTNIQGGRGRFDGCTDTDQMKAKLRDGERLVVNTYGGGKQVEVRRNPSSGALNSGGMGIVATAQIVGEKSAKALEQSDGRIGGYTVPPGKLQSNDAAGKPLTAEDEGWAACGGCDGTGNCKPCGGTGDNCSECGGSGECGDCAGEGHVKKSLKQNSAGRTPPQVAPQAEDVVQPTVPQVLAALYSHAKAEAAYIDQLNDTYKGTLSGYRDAMDKRVESIKQMYADLSPDGDIEKDATSFEEEYDKGLESDGPGSTMEPGEAGLVDQGDVPDDDQQSTGKTMKKDTTPAEGAYIEGDKDAANELGSGGAPYNKMFAKDAPELDAGDTPGKPAPYNDPVPSGAGVFGSDSDAAVIIDDPDDAADKITDVAGAPYNKGVNKAGETYETYDFKSGDRVVGRDGSQFAGREGVLVSAPQGWGGSVNVKWNDGSTSSVSSQWLAKKSVRKVAGDGAGIYGSDTDGAIVAGDPDDAADKLDDTAGAPFNKDAPELDAGAAPFNEKTGGTPGGPGQGGIMKAGDMCMCGMEIPDGVDACPGCGAMVQKIGDGNPPANPMATTPLPPAKEGDDGNPSVGSTAPAMATDPAAEEILERYRQPKSNKWATRKYLVNKKLLPFLKYRVAADGKKYLVQAKQQQKEPALDNGEIKALTDKLAGAIDALKALVKAPEMPAYYKAGLKHVADQIWYVGKALTDKGKLQRDAGTDGDTGDGGWGGEMADKGKVQRNSNADGDKPTGPNGELGGGGKGSLDSVGSQQGKSPAKSHNGRQVSPAVEQKLQETWAKLQRFGVV